MVEVEAELGSGGVHDARRVWVVVCLFVASLIRSAWLGGCDLFVVGNLSCWAPSQLSGCGVILYWVVGSEQGSQESSASAGPRPRLDGRASVTSLL